MAGDLYDAKCFLARERIDANDTKFRREHNFCLTIVKTTRQNAVRVFREVGHVCC